ncbi:MAG: hypothetical protein IH880_08820 [Candidatus Marinimicrobia bacterium]|nr:hypothetical protein [Candidatus Neomarinimicrobiota bacterium]
MKIGNEWVYDYKNNQSGLTGLLTWKITGSSVVGGKTVFHLNQSLPVVGREQTLLLANQHDGLYVYGEISDTGVESIYSTPRMYLKYPLADGETFVNWQGYTVELVTDGKLIDTGAGMFNALKYFLYEDTIKVGIIFWVIDVGPAIMEKPSIDQNSFVAIEISTLSRYTLN